MSRIVPSVLVLALALVAPRAGAQIAAGALFQSLDNAQNPGVTTVTLPGNPSVTRSEIVAWSAGDGAGGARSLVNFNALGTLFGDQTGDGLPFDLDDIDALEVGPYTQGNAPNLFDFRFSLANPVLNGIGLPIVTPGDIVRVTGIGTWQKVVTESTIQAALGTTQPINVDAYCELSDGSILVSLQGAGSGNGIINPIFGSVGFYQWSGADIFLIRPPLGIVPALLAYRQSELQTVVSFYYNGYQLSDIVGVEEQPFALPSNNPWDPNNVYLGGNRPPILWTVDGDENVFAGNAAANPLSPAHNFFSIVSGAAGAGYATNTPNPRVYADALAWGPFPLPQDSRITLDPDPVFAVNGGTLTLTVRSAEPAGTTFQIVATPNLGFNQGLVLPGFGFESMVLRITDPLLYLTLTPPLSNILTTGAATVTGEASTAALPVPSIFSSQNLYLQAFAIPSGALSAPATVRFN